MKKHLVHIMENHLVHIMEKHLDYELWARWEMIVGDKHYPSIKEFNDFLRNHLRSAEIYSNASNPSHNKKYQNTSSYNNTTVFKPRSTGFSKILTISIVNHYRF